ncbi:MAG: toxin-antitoxin system TumE family protein [Acidobacteriota bacterium]
MKAVLLLRRRVVVAADAFVEVVVWRLPEPVPPSTHGLKYRLAYVVKGRCVVRYDNERGKGDHRLYGADEQGYTFSTPDRLMADFQADIARWNHENGRT